MRQPIQPNSAEFNRVACLIAAGQVIRRTNRLLYHIRLKTLSAQYPRESHRWLLAMAAMSI